MTTMYADTSTAQRPAPPIHLSRTRLFGWSVVFMLTWPAATVLFCVWVTAAAISPLTLFVPVLVVLTGVVRGYVSLHRRWAERMLGEPTPPPYRPASGTGWLARAKAILLDPASWRDAAFLFVHSTLVATLSIVSFSLLAGGVFYLIYPFLFWVTPDNVFGTPFGLFTLRTVAQSCALMPLALACFALWYGTVRPIMLANARVTRALLR